MEIWLLMLRVSAQLRCGCTITCGDLVDHKEKLLLMKKIGCSCREVVAQWRCGLFCGHVVAQRRCGCSVEMWLLSGDVVSFVDMWSL